MLETILDHFLISILMTIITLYALFGDDIRVITSKKVIIFNFNYI